MKSITELSHLVGGLMRSPTTEANRFESMSVCSDIMCRHDVTRDDLMRETLRSWVGRLQERFQ